MSSRLLYLAKWVNAFKAIIVIVVCDCDMYCTVQHQHINYTYNTRVVCATLTWCTSYPYHVRYGVTVNCPLTFSLSFAIRATDKRICNSSKLVVREWVLENCITLLVICFIFTCVRSHGFNIRLCIRRPSACAPGPTTHLPTFVYMLFDSAGTQHVAIVYLLYIRSVAILYWQYDAVE